MQVFPRYELEFFIEKVFTKLQRADSRGGLIAEPLCCETQSREL